MIYCDTSYLVRLYLAEPGHEAVRELCYKDQVASAGHALVEVPAALHRAFREGRLASAIFQACVEQFQNDCAAEAYLWLPAEAALVASMAGRYAKLPQTAFLRAADALHLACAAEHGFTEVYSNDRHFLAAAPLFGLKGINIITS